MIFSILPNTSNFENARVPIPRRSAQRWIVAELVQLMALMEKIVNNSR